MKPRILILAAIGIAMGCTASAESRLEERLCKKTVEALSQDGDYDVVVINDTCSLSFESYKLTGGNLDFIAPTALVIAEEPRCFIEVEASKEVCLFDLVTNPRHNKRLNFIKL